MNEESCNVSQVHSEASFDSQKLKVQRDIDATHRAPASVNDVVLVDKNRHSKIYFIKTFRKCWARH
jgi:hypothetical protein